MPELAEVEFGRRLAEAVCLGRRIDAVWCDDDPIVLDGRTPADWRAALEGARVLAVLRHGKQLWFALDRPPHPLFHFGMTGAFRTPAGRPLALASSPRAGEPEQWPPRFTKILLTLGDGGRLAMTNKRRLGRLRLRDRPREEPPISRLGFDPLHSMPGPDDLRDRLQRRRSLIKALLLDQSFAAGLGNWLADEVLFQSGIAPTRRAHTLTAAEVAGLHAAIESVVQTAVSVDADKGRFPAHWLFHRRWGRPRGAVTADGEPIEIMEVAGRSTAWVPSRQR